MNCVRSHAHLYLWQWYCFMNLRTNRIWSRGWENVAYYRPQTKLREGNAFTPVCQTPPGRHPLGRPPLEDTPPQRRPLKQAVCILLECILAPRHARPLWACTPPMGTHAPHRHTCPLGTHAPSPGRYDEMRSMSGRYASYWNAFLF